MPSLHVLRVFVGPGGTYGNPLGVFLDGGKIPRDARQAVAVDLGFSETVFVDDPVAGRIAIFTPGEELEFAGHPTVGTSWLLSREREPVDVLRPPAGEVATWTDGELTWIRGRPEWAPPFEHAELGSAEEVDALQGPPGGHGMIQAWAWQDRDAGDVRARVFVRDLGIEEDEATGAASLRLATRLGRPITIHQGRGSVIASRPGPDGTGEVGGLVVLDELRDYAR